MSHALPLFLKLPPYTFLSSQAAETMEDLSSSWRFQENLEQLKQKLQQKTFELESLKMEAYEESIKNKEKVKSLILLLQAAYEERDEAREQLQKLSAAYDQFPALLHFKANSSITTESNSLYETNYNHQSHGSSPADSFFDGVSSSDFLTIDMADSSKTSFVNQPFVQEYTAPLDIPKTENVDPFCAVIDNLVKGKTLPQKGRLLEAVTEAGPLLQTLLVAGPLPQWRNPPPLQAFKIPPLYNNTKNINHSLFQAEMPQICSDSSLLSFNNGPSGSCFNSALMLAPNVNNTQILAAKRQKIQ